MASSVQEWDIELLNELARQEKLQRVQRSMSKHPNIKNFRSKPAAMHTKLENCWSFQDEARGNK
jgi:hypothetical protein